MYRNILVAGLTGSGKTTFSTAVSVALGITRVSGSVVRQTSIMDGALDDDSADRRRFWLFDEAARRADLERMNPDTPDSTDLALLELHERSLSTVFDVWFLPWLVEPGSLRVWLESPADVRARRVAGSDDRLRSAPDVAAAVAGKDDRSRAYGLKHYEVDVFTDREPFEVIIINDGSTSLDVLGRLMTSLASAALFDDAGDLALTGPDRTTAAAALRRCPAELTALLDVGADGTPLP
ncbi:hypothetical protein [Actinoplanes solisilvae]|uniref:hypothetical protein n=1 Tax=Actinoplanes solisilvae TaxID=2486853 RepID=UPI000FDCAC9F|nr:hypothetical protein [Actinoplanes solisilvae]